jgi:hypothetical protein
MQQSTNDYTRVNFINANTTPYWGYYLLFGSMFWYFSSVCLNLSLSTGFKYPLLLTGYFSKSPAGLVGRFSSPPPQLGQTFNKTSFTQSLQKVHSNEQIIASLLSLGSCLPQFSQIGFISSIFYTVWFVMNGEIERVSNKT